MGKSGRRRFHAEAMSQAKPNASSSIVARMTRQSGLRTELGSCLCPAAAITASSVFTLRPGQPLLYLGPSTSFDSRSGLVAGWHSIVFHARASHGDAPENFLVQNAASLCIPDRRCIHGQCRKVWSSPDTLAGSLPDLAENEPLFWMADRQAGLPGELTTGRTCTLWMQRAETPGCLRLDTSWWRTWH